MWRKQKLGLGKKINKLCSIYILRHKNSQKMEKLASIFRGKGEVSGVVFYLLFRHEKLALYLRIDPEKTISYEVVEVKEHTAGTGKFGGVEVAFAAKESYPKAHAWGAHERGTSILSKAIKYFNDFAADLKYNVSISEDDIAAAHAAALQETAT